MRARSLEGVVVLGLVFGGSAMGQAGTGLCPDGSAPFQQSFEGCYPPDCGSLHLGDWGIGGVPLGVIEIPKFDPADGELISVELAYYVQPVGDVCVDNEAASCGHASMTTWIISNGSFSANNDPPIASGPFQIDDQDILLPIGFYLGSADGVQDCFVGPTGPPSIGDCAPGEDHYVGHWESEYGTPIQLVTDPLDLLSWIRSEGTPPVVQFDTDCAGGLIANMGANINHYRSYSARAWLEVTYTYCRPGTGYCSGDAGSGTPCPCGNANDGTVPGAGCPSASFPSGGHLHASGNASLAADSVVLVASGVEPLNTGLFFQGSTRVNGGDGIAFGDGLLCAGGSLVRLQVDFSTAAGNVQTSIPLGVAGGVAAGETKRYQYWYRTSIHQPCAGLVNDFNTTNGYELVWTP